MKNTIRLVLPFIFQLQNTSAVLWLCVYCYDLLHTSGQLVHEMCLYYNTLFITSFNSPYTLWMTYFMWQCMQPFSNMWFMVPFGSFQAPVHCEFMISFTFVLLSGFCLRFWLHKHLTQIVTPGHINAYTDTFLQVSKD